MMMPCLVVVSGAPCSGKSTLARELRATLHWPLLAKDAFKEAMFDSLGWSDRQWSRRLSAAAYAVMFSTANELIASGSSCMLEGNFRWEEQGERLSSLITRPNVHVVQIFCTADTQTLVSRFQARVDKGARHPGHVDAESAAELLRELRERPPRPLPLEAELFVFDSGASGRAGATAFVQTLTRRVQDLLQGA